MVAPHELGRTYETSLSAAVRRRDGIHYTPPLVVADLVDHAVGALGHVPQRVLDPTCGGGAFLLGVLDAMVRAGVDPDVALGRVHGIDRDPGAVAVARTALEGWADAHGVDVAAVPDRLVVGDALEIDWPTGLDLVVGNPPFGGQLRGSTVRDRARAERAASLLGRRSGYADTAGLFLVRAVDAVDVGGVVVLMQPASILAARDATVVRRRVDARGTVRAVRFCDPTDFDASVQICAPVIVRDRVGTGIDGRDDDRSAWSWSELAADALGLAVAPPESGRVLGDIADVTAGFRDEFYAVASCVVEAGPDDERPRLVTAGGIEPGRVLWGERPTTVLRRRFDRPVVDVDALRRWAVGPVGSARIASRLASRTAPKVLVATQTRRLEAVADPGGRLWPSVPVVSVVPRDGDVWSVLAILVSQEATAWMVRRAFGTGMSFGALRVSARVLADLPLPAASGAWAEAGSALEGGASVDDPVVLGAMARAYAGSVIRRRSAGSGAVDCRSGPRSDGAGRPGTPRS